MSLAMPETPSRPDSLIQQLLDRARIHAAFVHQVQHDTRIEVARARSHRQAIDCGETHRRGDAAAGLQRAHAGAVAEVQHDRPARGGSGVDRRQHRGDVFVTQAVETVAAHARLVHFVGQSEHLREFRIGAMKRRIEAGDLRHLRGALHHCTDRGEVVRLVQRRERDEAGRAPQATASSTRTGCVYCIPPWTTRCPTPTSWRTARTLAQECEQMRQRAVVAELGACGPVPLADLDALGVLRDETRLAEE